MQKICGCSPRIPSDGYLGFRIDVLLLTLFAIVGCSKSGVNLPSDMPSKNDASTFAVPPGTGTNSDMETERKSVIAQPTNDTSLLKNLKMAWDKQLLIDSDFYEDASLKSFFNASNLSWDTPKMPN